ncbi:MAG: hypothetical protein ABW171_04220 [Steroidobacter sp.]
MNQQSEDLVPESPPAEGDAAAGARILHMKSTPYDLQRAIQQRAQESVEREAGLDREQRRPKPLKWLIISAIACLPIVFTLVLVDGFLRAFHRYLDVTVSQQPQPGESDSPAPAETLQSNQPGVVLLQPMTIPEQAPASQAAPQSSEQSKN